MFVREFHGSVIGGHSRVLKTYRRMEAELYWVGMYKDVEEMLPQCDVPTMTQISRHVPIRTRVAFTLPKKVWEEVTMDLILPFFQRKRSFDSLNVWFSLWKLSELVG